MSEHRSSEYTHGFRDGYSEWRKDAETALYEWYENGYKEAEEKYTIYYDLFYQLVEFISQKPDVLDEFVDSAELTEEELSLIKRAVRRAVR